MAPVNLMDTDVPMPGYKADALPTHISMRHDPKQTPQPASAGDAPIIDMSGFDALNLHAPPRAPRANLQKASDPKTDANGERLIRKPVAPSLQYNSNLDRKKEDRLERVRIRIARTYNPEDPHDTYWAPSECRRRGSESSYAGDMSYYGGGGGGGGGGGRGGYDRGGAGRKRRFRDDDEYDQRGPAMRKRHRDEPASTKLRNLVLPIGDIPRQDTENVIMDASRLMADHGEDEYLRTYAGELFTKFILEQPLKIPHAAAIIVQLHSYKADFAQVVVDRIGKELQEKIDQGEWRAAKLLLRFLGLAQSIFNGDAVFGVLDELFNRAIDLQAASSEDVLGLELVKIIMLTIPYVLAWNSEFRSRADELLEKTAVVASTPHDVEAAVVPHLEIEGEPSNNSPGVLSMLHQQLQNEAESDFALSFLVRFPQPRKFTTDDAEDANGDESVRLTFPSIVIPETVKAAQPVFPEVWVSVYADQDVESVPRTSNIASTLLRDVLVDTIDILDFNRVQSANFLINVESYFAPGTFARRATAFEKIRNAGSGEPTWKSEDILIDAIFSQLLRLPQPHHKIVYYHSVITEACRYAPAAIAPSLGRAIRFLYRSIDTLDAEIVYRFLDWFSHHLSNFDFRWKWVEWNADVALSPLSPRKSFLFGALDKEIRLSFAKRIRETLPQPYHRLIPPKRDNEKPIFKFDPELNHPFATQGNELLTLLRKKASDEEFEAAVAEIHRIATEQDPSLADPTPISTDIFVTALCQIGFKSLSHVLSFIERNRSRLLTLTSDSPAARIQIVSSVVDYWVQHQPGLAVNIIDKLLNYSIVAPADVLRWALASPERLQGGALLACHWVYELVAGTLAKVCRRVQQVAAARNAPGLPDADAAELEAALAAERANLAALFASVDDALAAVAAGATDAQLAGAVDLAVLGLGPAARTELDVAADVANGDVDPEEAAWRVDAALEGDALLRVLRLWGEKWQRVFRRKRAVEEMLVAAVVAGWPAPGVVDEGEGEGEGGEDGMGEAPGEDEGDGEGDAP